MTADERRPRFALDTNILVYAIDTAAGPKLARAELVVRRAAEGGRCTLALQSIGEFYRAATRKGRLTPEEAARGAKRLMRFFPVVPPHPDDALTALAEAAAGRFSYWDALLIATVGRAGCRVLLSEDMRAGSTLAGVTILNPLPGDDLPEDVAALLD